MNYINVPHVGHGLKWVSNPSASWFLMNRFFLLSQTTQRAENVVLPLSVHEIFGILFSVQCLHCKKFYIIN